MQLSTSSKYQHKTHASHLHLIYVHILPFLSWNDLKILKDGWESLAMRFISPSNFSLFVFDELSHPNAVKSLPNNYPVVGHKLLLGDTVSRIDSCCAAPHCA